MGWSGINATVTREDLSARPSPLGNPLPRCPPRYDVHVIVDERSTVRVSGLRRVMGERVKSRVDVGSRFGVQYTMTGEGETLRGEGPGGE